MLFSYNAIFANVNPAVMVAPAIAARNARRAEEEAKKQKIHEQNYHQFIIEGDWQDLGCSIERVFTHKDENGKRHYIYSVIRHYQRTDWYSCREHSYRTYQHNEYIRPASKEEIKHWNKNHIIKIFILVVCFIFIIILFIVSCIRVSKIQKTEELEKNITYTLE